MKKKEKLTTTHGAPVVDNQNTMTAGPRGPVLLQDVWFLEKLAHFDREVIPERRMHAKGSGAYGTFTVTHDITRYTKAKIFSAGGQEDRPVRPLLHGGRRARRRRRRARHPRLRHEVLHRGGQLGPGGQQHAGLLPARPAQVPRPQPRRQARPAHQPAQRPEQLGLLDLAARGAAPGHHRHERPGHPRLLPPHARLRQPHLQLHQRQERALLGEVPPPDPAGDQEPDRRGGRGDHRQGPRKPPARPVREHREEATSRAGPCSSRSCRRRTRPTYPLPPLRPHQGLAPQGLSADRGRASWS